MRFPLSSSLLGSNLKFVAIKHNSLSLLCTEREQEIIKRHRSFWSWSKKPEEEKLKIVKPDNCELNEPLLHPKCKIAIIVNGTKGLGLAAGHTLLQHGAKNIVMTDDNISAGRKAVDQLCQMHGRERARFVSCSFNNTCKFEAAFESALCKHKHVHILLNNADEVPPKTCVEKNGFDDNDDNWSITRRAIEVGLNFMSIKNGGAGGIIINTGRILGFMGWPEEPTPVYCNKEPVVETTQDLAKKHDFEKTGVRIITLLEASKSFEDIGLPDFPTVNSKLKHDNGFSTRCSQMMESKIGTALLHVSAKAENGSTWLMEPVTSPRDFPRLIHFPKEGEKIDPRIYTQTHCPPAFQPFCAASSNTECSVDISKHCSP